MGSIITPAGLMQEIQKGAFKPNIYLTNMSLAYFQAADQYVAKSLFPMLPVQLSTASYYKFSKGDLARDNVQRKPQFGKVAPAIMGLSDDNYRVEVDQVITGLDQIQTLDFVRSKAPGVADPRRAKAKFIAEQMNIHLDILFADKFFKTGAWTNEWTGNSAFDASNKKFIQFDNSNCDPVELFDYLSTTMLQNGRRKPNKLGLGINAFNALKNCQAVLDRVKFGGSTANPATVNEKVLAELFGLKEVKVFASTYNAAQYGEADDMQFICDPNDALLVYTTDSPAIDEPTAGYIFTWDMLGDGQVMPVHQYLGEPATHTEFMEGLMATDMKKTADDLAVYLHNCVSSN
jgi:hypothetical protein